MVGSRDRREQLPRTAPDSTQRAAGIGQDFTFIYFLPSGSPTLSLKPLGFHLLPPDSSTQSPNLFKHVKRKKKKKNPQQDPSGWDKNLQCERVAKNRGGWQLWLQGARPERRPTKGKKKWAKKYLAILPLPREQGDKEKIVICLHTGYIFLHTLGHTSRYSTCKNICYTSAHPRGGVGRIRV